MKIYLLRNLNKEGCGKHMLKPLKIFLTVSITLLSCMLLSTLAAGQNKAEWLNDRVTTRFQEEPMSKVLGEIAQQTGIAILYDEKLADQKVTGYYKDVKFSEAINRLFSEKNKSIQVFKSEKKIIVKTFGAKQFILASSNKTAPDQSLNNAEPITVGDLEKMHRQQYKEYKERIADENELLELEGMTKKELRFMHEQQYKKNKALIANVNELLEDEEMTRGELRNVQEQQYKKNKEHIANENDFLKDEEMTRKELRNAQEQQYKKNKEHIANENDLFKDEGMTRKELRNVQEQQYEKYKRERRNPRMIVN